MADDDDIVGRFVCPRGLGRIHRDGRIVFDPRECGSMRKLYTVRERPPRGRGRPPYGYVWRKDKIVGHVQHLQRLEPDRPIESIVAEVRAFHGVSRETVFKALREHAPDEPILIGFGWRLDPSDPAT
jgi:hypothetical protein